MGESGRRPYGKRKNNRNGGARQKRKRTPKTGPPETHKKYRAPNDYANKSQSIPHEGSYATKALRTKYGVVLQRELPKMEDDGGGGGNENSETSTNDKMDTKNSSDGATNGPAAVTSTNVVKTEPEATTSAVAAVPEAVPETTTTSTTTPTKTDTADQSTPTPSRKDLGVKKRKIAILLGYVGSRYGGFQMNNFHRTVQAELELALFHAGMITPHNFGYPHKYSWSTSGRTDKGVHACAQVVSAKLEWRDSWAEGTDGKETNDEPVALVNQYLPDDIRVFDMQRTTRNFCAKTQRCRVRYQYMIPSFVFCNVDKLRDMFVQVMTKPKDDTANDQDNNGNTIPPETMLAQRPPLNGVTPEEISQLQQHPTILNYRASKEQLDLLADTLHMYAGTKPYHNFTRGMLPGHKSALRYILSFERQDPVVVDGVEWIPTQVLGQSFLLNQIRKMIGVAMDVVRGVIDQDKMEQALDSKYYMNRVPVAPAQGLFMEMSIYEGYNERKNNDNIPPLDWMEYEDSDDKPTAVQRWKDFKEQTIWEHIVKEEKEEGNFLQHLFIQTFIHDVKGAYTPEEYKNGKPVVAPQNEPSAANGAVKVGGKDEAATVATQEAKVAATTEADGTKETTVDTNMKDATES